MKTIKTISTVITAMLLLVATESALAQVAETSTDVSIAAEVVGTLSLSEEVGELNFGLVGQDIGGNGAGTNPSIDPTDGTTTNILDETDLTIAKYVLTGTDGLTVEFDYANLELTNGSKVLNFLPEISSADGDATTNTTASGGTTLPGNDQVIFSGTNMTLWVGGTLEEADTGIAMVAGTYSGSLTITVDYVE